MTLVKETKSNTTKHGSDCKMKTQIRLLISLRFPRLEPKVKMKLLRTSPRSKRVKRKTRVN